MTNPGSILRIFVRSSHRQDSGQALIETAITLPLLLLLMLGGVEFARLTYAAIEVSNAAKAAVAYGAQNVVTASDTNGIQAAAQMDAGNLSSITTTVTSPPSCSCVTSGVAISDSCSDTTCAIAGGYLQQTLQVTTSTTIDPIIHLPGLPTTFTLRGYANQVVMQ